MDGIVPLGCDRDNRTLKINEQDSIKIKLIVEKYLEFKNVSRLMQYLKDKQIKTKSDKNFSKGNLYYFLKNKIYTGKVVHKQNEYDGEHPAIFPTTLLASNAIKKCIIKTPITPTVRELEKQEIYPANHFTYIFIYAIAGGYFERNSGCDLSLKKLLKMY